MSKKYDDIDAIADEVREQYQASRSVSFGDCKDRGRSYAYEVNSLREAKKITHDLIADTKYNMDPNFHRRFGWKRMLEVEQPSRVRRQAKTVAIRKDIRAEARQLCKEMLFKKKGFRRII